jgi:hypothetical protein
MKIIKTILGTVMMRASPIIIYKKLKIAIRLI